MKLHPSAGSDGSFDIRASHSQPAEWERHEAVWLAWPSDDALWLDNLKPAQDEFVEFCRAIADFDPRSAVARGERLHILIPNEVARSEAARRLAGLPIKFFEIPYGDIWLRDTAPVFLKSSAGVQMAATFAFNGWGGKYILLHDREVAARTALASGLKTLSNEFVLEGGSVEVDGEGTCLTSKQCLLNENRNPGMSQADLEQHLSDSLGIKKVLWFGDGLLNDHTDGHIDTIARFVAPGEIALMRAQAKLDPNYAILEKLILEAEGMVDAKGRKLKVHLVPSPGTVQDADGRIMPASYLNFYISNTSVIVPTYGVAYDSMAVSAIAKCFPDHKTVGLSARAILSGGGAFHCISQQLPA